MRLTLFILTYLCLTVSTFAQYVNVKSFEKIQLTKRVYFPTDYQTNKKTALIKITTSSKNIKFEGDLYGINKVESMDDGYFVFVPVESKYISILRNEKIALQTFEYPEQLKSSNIYEIKLISSNKKTRVNSEWILFISNPDSAKVYINNELIGITPFQKKFQIKEYKYSFKKDLYYTEKGSFKAYTNNVNRMIYLNLMPAFGKINIKTETPGVEIFIDDKQTSYVTPYTFEQVSNGKHTIILVHPQYKPKMINVNVQDNKTVNINEKLIPIYGNMYVSTEPPDAEIKLNDKIINYSPANIQNILIGKYNLKITKHKHKTVNTIIEIKENEITKINLKLLPTILVKFDVFPVGTNISINDSLIGISPCNVYLTQGEHLIEYSKLYFASKTKTVLISQSEQTIKDKLKSDKINTTFNSVPKKTTVRLDNTRIGKTPLNTTLNTGEYDIEYRHKGYLTYSDKINIGSQSVFYANLRPDKYRGKGTALLLSTVWAGSGVTYLQRGGPAWLVGIVPYGLGLMSYIKYNEAENIYQDYLNLVNGLSTYVYSSEINALISEFQKLDEQSDMYLYAAIGTWSANMIWTLLTKSDKKRYPNMKFSAYYNRSDSGVVFKYKF